MFASFWPLSLAMLEGTAWVGHAAPHGPDSLRVQITVIEELLKAVKDKAACGAKYTKKIHRDDGS